MSNDDLSVFDDAPNIGLGADGQYHNDPYCAAIAPIGSYEAQHGEVCGYCERRKQKREAEDPTIDFDARFDARLEAAARMDRAFWGLG